MQGVVSNLPETLLYDAATLVLERIGKIRQELYLVSETRLVSLLESAGFERVERFFTSLLVGGWIAQKKCKFNFN